MVTIEQIDLLATIIRRLVDNDMAWFAEQAIIVGDKPPFWILNYAPIGRNDYNRLVRGLVVRQPVKDWSGDPLSLVVSFPFVRFFNQHEPEAEAINFANSEMLEKLDGSMVGVFFPTANFEQPYWHTRRMISSHPADCGRRVDGFRGRKQSHQLIPLIGEYVRRLQFKKPDTPYTFVFEFIHPASQVLTKYAPSQHGLHLLGGRRLNDFRELTENELDEAAKRLGCPRPRRWDAETSSGQIAEMIEEAEKTTPYFEGFVFRDQTTGARVKVKSPEYVRLHHVLATLSYKSLLPKVVEGEAEEILAYFPDARERIETIRERLNAYRNYVIERVLHWRDRRLDRKSLAIELFQNNSEADRYVRMHVMKLFEESDDDVVRREVDAALREMAMGDETKSPKRKALLDCLGLRDVEEFATDPDEP